LIGPEGGLRMVFGYILVAECLKIHKSSFHHQIRQTIKSAREEEEEEEEEEGQAYE